MEPGRSTASHALSPSAPLLDSENGPSSLPSSTASSCLDSYRGCLTSIFIFCFGVRSPCRMTAITQRSSILVKHKIHLKMCPCTPELPPESSFPLFFQTHPSDSCFPHRWQNFSHTKPGRSAKAVKAVKVLQTLTGHLISYQGKALQYDRQNHICNIKDQAGCYSIYRNSILNCAKLVFIPNLCNAHRITQKDPGKNSLVQKNGYYSWGPVFERPIRTPFMCMAEPFHRHFTVSANTAAGKHHAAW